MLLLGLPLRLANRIIGWAIARDCTCGAETAPDWFHAVGCPHPIKKHHG